MSSWAWVGRRLLRNVVVLAVLGVCVLVATSGNPLPKIGFAETVAGVPVNRTLPALTGDQRLGGVMTCSRGTWNEPEGATYKTSFQWVRDNADLTGETSATHTVTAADIGHGLRCDVRADSDTSTATARSQTYYPPAPDNLTAPRVTGDLRLGRTLSCSRGAWNDDNLPAYPTTIAWLRNGEVISGQTASSYTVTAADVGRQVYCRVSVLALANATSNGVYPTAPQIRVSPQISGDLRLGGTLSCAKGDWDDEAIAPYAVAKRWLRDGAEILGAEGDTYTVRLADIGHGLRCRVRAADLTETDSSTVYPTSPGIRNQPGVEGDPRLGRSLTCKRGTWDDAGRTGEYAATYEWYRNNALVAETASYDVKAADVNTSLRCLVTVEGVAQSYSPYITGTAPRNLSAPMITGDARVGRTLSCSRGTWDDQGIDPYLATYQWYRSSQPVAGATGATYSVTKDDANRGLYCRVTAAGLTSANSQSVSVAAPDAVFAPVVEGDPRTGSTLTCSRGSWDDPATPYAVSYQWYRNGNTVIADATNATYTVTDADKGTYVRCYVKAEGLTDSVSAVIYHQTGATGGTATNYVAPSISGDRRLRHALTCSRGTWNDTADARYAVTYRWRRNSINIPGATAATYTVTSDDVGQTLYCDVRANNQTTASSGGVSPAIPRAVASPAVSGDPRVRQTLSCDRGGWNDDANDRYAVTYRWLRNNSAITGATSDTYTVTAADIGTTLSCEVRAENLAAATSPGVGIDAPRVVLSQVLGGQPRLRKTMSCSRGTWDDIAADRYATTFQWLRDNVAIDGQTGATYAVAAADTGHSVSCTVRAEDRTNAGPVNGAETIDAPVNTVTPKISGQPRLRQTLTCSRGDWDDEAADRYAVTYRWQRDGTDIQGATAATYTTTRADVNTNLYCRVRAEDLTTATSPAFSIRRPDNLVAPGITGDLRLNRTLSCTRGDWDDTAADRYAVTYTWLRAGVPIQGATTANYTVTRDDVNKQLYCRVRAEDFVDANSASVYPEYPRAITPPAISGQPHLRGELACTRGTWDDTPDRRYAISYQWYRSGQPINGATDPTYVIGVTDLGRYLTCTATAEVLADSSAPSLYVTPPDYTVYPTVEGIAHPRRELSCTRGEWNDSPGKRYVLSFQWRRNNQPIPDADKADYIVDPADVGAYVTCAVTAEGSRTAVSAAVYPSWEPLRITLAPDADATAANAANAYTLRVRNDNPVPVPITQLDLTLPGGFSYRPGTTTGALTVDPVPTGAGSLTQRWTQDFTVPALGEAVIRVGVTAGSALGDHFASARAYPVSSAFNSPETGLTARVTTEAAQPTGACTITGTEDDDVLAGTAGADVICGLGGDDLIQGLGGNDELWGGAGDDRLEGGDGDDSLRGGDGNDVLDGEAGRDVFRGGGGLDTLTYATRTEPVSVTVGDGEADDGELGEQDTVSSDVEIVRGGTGNDRLTGGPGPDELYGRAGDDTLDGGDGAGDLLDGGDGNDTLKDDDGFVDRLYCGGGTDNYDADLLDRIVGCELPFATEGLL